MRHLFSILFQDPEILDENKRCCGNWSLVLNNEYETYLLQSISTVVLGVDKLDNIQVLANAIENRIQKYFQDEDDISIDREIDVLCIGISLLNLFVQNNWTGPATKCQPTDFLSKGLSNKAEELKAFCKEALSSNSVPVYPLLDYPEYLLLAKVILVQCRPLLKSCQTSDWWAMRCLWIQQQLMDEKSPEIHEQIMNLRESIFQNDSIMSCENNKELCVRFHLECSPICHYYYHYQKSRDHLEAAQKAAGITVSFTGALGKRTKFQQTNCAQLIVKVEKHGDVAEKSFSRLSEDAKSLVKQHLPKDLQLDDDVILEHVKLLERSESESPSLTALEQAIILALFAEHKRNSAKFELLKEELSAYIENIVAQPQCWGAQLKALMARSLLEKDKGRKIERAMMQMEVLVNELKQDKCPVSVRFHQFYALNLPPKWVVEGEFASLLYSLGSTSAALQIYLRLNLWEDAVHCYQRLDKLDKAERLIQEQLSIKETPLMLCLLGEVTRKPEYYLKAWEVSNQTSARAQRSLGRLYLDEKKYEESIQCFEKSLERNSLQYNTWFLLGFAAIKSEQHRVAIRAYRKCVTIEVDNFEAWNNLAHSHIKLKEKDKAHMTLQEAIKCNYESAKVWENFLFVAIDVGDFQGSIRAYHRLLDFQEKYTDVEILNILVTAVVEDLLDKGGIPASQFRKKLLELFGRLTSTVTGNAEVWRSYARLLGDCNSTDQMDNDKAVQCLQKSHRSRTQTTDWSKEVESCKKIMEQSIELAKAYQLVSGAKSSQVEAIQLLSSAKLMLKSVVSNTKLHHGQFENESTTEMSGLQSQLEQELQNVIAMINIRKEQV
ncbi:tetratricopeptide repeat protein 27-like [Anneissia japonica]|uniref:tetratricopeptide repeat protein 27-like n=1 Tax=Anneissia japonica TaxID=1529436 RepID=UPI0014258D3E|nr:tetratricopeptide repeat protein 27-like [Anneissia japonica]